MQCLYRILDYPHPNRLLLACPGRADALLPATAAAATTASTTTTKAGNNATTFTCDPFIIQ